MLIKLVNKQNPDKDTVYIINPEDLDKLRTLHMLGITTGIKRYFTKVKMPKYQVNNHPALRWVHQKHICLHRGSDGIPVLNYVDYVYKD